MTSDEALHIKQLFQRFNAFLMSVDGSECIDALSLTQEQKEGNRADFFFNNREIICELKTLEVDTDYRKDKVIEPLKERSDWPIIFGRVGLNKVIENFPDKENIKRDLAYKLSDSIETLVRKANKQIRETKMLFGAEESAGVLIVLNEVAYALNPNVIAYRFGKLFRKNDSDGNPRFPHVNAALVLSTAHFLQGDLDSKIFPIVAMKNHLSSDVKADEFLNALMPQWAAFDGIPLYRSDWEDLNLRFRQTNKS